VAGGNCQRHEKDADIITISKSDARLLQQAFIFDIVFALGGVVVSVLATGSKGRGFKPGRLRWILRVIKSVARLPAEGK
jgi:hypothetical protein